MRTKAFNPQTAQSQALQLFWRNGYAQTSMADLLDHLGISRSSFYSAFGDKRSLYEQSLKDFAAMSQMATQTLRSNKAIRDQLLDFFDLSFVLHGRDIDQGCLLVNTLLEQHAHDPELAQLAREYLESVEQAIANALEQSMNRGDISHEIGHKQLATLIMVVIKGLRVASKEGKTATELRALFQISIERFGL